MPTLDNQLLSLSIAATVNNPLDLQTATSPLNYSKAYQMVSGVAGGQADRLFTDTRTIAPSANDDLDLAGVLIDPLGNLLTFARIKAILVVAAPGNTNNVVIGGAGANAFFTWIDANTSKVTLKPGAGFALYATDATAYPVTAGTGDILRIANSGAGTSVTYDIVLIGASA